MEFSRQEYWSGQPIPPPGDFHDPGIEPRSPTLQADSLPAETPGKPRNSGVDSPSLLKWIFPTQESNWGLLHCRRILYRLSYEGSLLLHILSAAKDKLQSDSEEVIEDIYPLRQLVGSDY